MYTIARPITVEELEREYMGMSEKVLTRAYDGTLPEPLLAQVRSTREYREFAEAAGKKGYDNTLDDLMEEAESNVQLPPAIQAAIAQKCAAEEVLAGAAVKQGSVVLVTGLGESAEMALGTILRSPIAILLDEPCTNRRGDYCHHGWIVSSRREIGYAVHGDIPLRENLGTFAPEAGFVQLWNPVIVTGEMLSGVPVVGVLSEYGERKVRIEATRFLTDQESIARHEQLEEVWRYRNVYLRVARLINRAALL